MPEPYATQRFGRVVWVAVSAAAAVATFLAVASHALNWSDTTTFVVGAALVAFASLLGTPLLLLPGEIRRAGQSDIASPLTLQPEPGTTATAEAPPLAQLMTTPTQIRMDRPARTLMVIEQMDVDIAPLTLARDEVSNVRAMPTLVLMSRRGESERSNQNRVRDALAALDSGFASATNENDDESSFGLLTASPN